MSDNPPEEEPEKPKKMGRPKGSKSLRRPPKDPHHQMVCVRVPNRMIREGDKLRKVVARHMPYALDATRSDVYRVALSLGFEQLKKEL